MTMHPATLSLALRDASMTVRLSDGRLLVNPIASLAGELREAVVSHRAALVAYLEGAEEAEAKADALAEEAVRSDPFALPREPEGRGTTLVRVNLDGEPPEYVAIDPDYWRDLCRWAKEAREANLRRPPKRPRKVRKR